MFESFFPKPKLFLFTLIRNLQPGIYPALDIPNSVSRVMAEITSVEHQETAANFRSLVSLYLENRDLIILGGYSVGQDPELDEAVNLWPNLVSYLQQNQDVKANFDASIGDLEKVMSG